MKLNNINEGNFQFTENIEEIVNNPKYIDLSFQK